MSTSTRARYITAAQLKRKGACTGQVYLFEQLFGKGGKVKITGDTAYALSQAFSPQWAVDHLLTEAQEKVYRGAIRGALRSVDTDVSPYAKAQQIMRGVQSTTAREEDKANPGVTKTIPSTFFTVRAHVEHVYFERLRQAQAIAFAEAYNSPKA